MDEGRGENDPDWTDVEAEGLPVMDEQPPGIGAETASEGRFLPGDVPIAAEEMGVTAAEEMVPETLRERVARERPDVEAPSTGDAGGRLVDPDPAESGELVGDWDEEDPGGLTAEEAAVHVSDE